MTARLCRRQLSRTSRQGRCQRPALRPAARERCQRPPSPRPARRGWCLVTAHPGSPGHRLHWQKSFREKASAASIQFQEFANTHTQEDVPP